MFNGTIHSKALSKFSTIELGRKKDIIAVTDEREVAEAVADGVREAILDNGHVQSGRLLNSISVVKSGGEYEVKAKVMIIVVEVVAAVAVAVAVVVDNIMIIVHLVAKELEVV